MKPNTVIKQSEEDISMEKLSKRAFSKFIKNKGIKKFNPKAVKESSVPLDILFNVE